MTAFSINNFPDIFRSYLHLIEVAHTFDDITDETHPNQDERVALKESLISQMAELITDHKVPLIFIIHATDNGLRAAFLRVIGEHGQPHHYLPVIENIALQTGPKDWNMKWQVVRAYTAMYLRHSQNPKIVESVLNAIPTLSVNADAALTAGIAHMSEIFGISTD